MPDGYYPVMLQVTAMDDLFGTHRVAVTPDGRHAYVTNATNNNVSVIEIDSG